MPKNVLKGLSVIVGLLFLYGCAATKNVEVRRYIDIKDRLDQDMEGGNAGFIGGKPRPEDRSDIRKTRKIYVVEVSKGVGEDEEEVIIEDMNTGMAEPSFKKEDYRYDTEKTTGVSDLQYQYKDESIGKTSKPTALSGPSLSGTDYTVQKDDTLQKISKKFYDSYSKWPKIYEANKSVIDDPDRIKPGIVIRIPKL